MTTSPRDSRAVQPGMQLQQRNLTVSRTAAVVFDCDGLLLDTEPLWGMAEQDFLESLGGRWDNGVRRLTHGRSVQDSAASLVALTDSALPPESASEQLVSRFGETVERRGVQLMPGALALLNALEDIPLAVASNTPGRLVERMLRRAGVRDRFRVVIGAGGRLRPKPEPDVYLAACRALGTPASKTHALEDSQTGVDAALTAGLEVIGVNSDPDTRLRGCSAVVVDLTALVPDERDFEEVRDG